MVKRIIKLVPVFVLVLSIFSTIELQAAQISCTEWTAQNKSRQNYTRYTTTIKSYLFSEESGYVRIQYDSVKGIFAEYYDKEFQLTDVKRINDELPIFGGVHKSGGYFYIVTGQENLQESADIEVFRITKYDASWNRINSVGLYDCNTTIPFDAGSLRMTDDGQYLIIRTSHEMYTSDDGYNHQANVTIQVDMQQMKITRSYTDVMNTSYGYVSHSFNQFVGIDNGKLVAVDHGDAYPRSIVLINYTSDIATGDFLASKGCSATDIIEFSGEIGDNTTNATVGGFEVTPSTYLIAGNSVVQDEQFDKHTTRNIYVASVDKTTKEVSVTWLTNYAEGEETTKTPQMVKISDDKYLVAWEREGKIFYTTVNTKGAKTSEIYSCTGNLSDCAPICDSGKVIWYVCDGGQIDFYQINAQNLTDSTVTRRNGNHDYQYISTSNGVAKVQCLECGTQKEAAVPSDLDIWWNTDGGNTYYSNLGARFETGSVLHLWTEKYYSSSLEEVLSEVEISTSDEEIVVIEKTMSDQDDMMAVINLNKAGTVSLTIAPKYNPSVGRTYKFEVYDPLQMGTFTAECGKTQKYGNTVVLTTQITGGYQGEGIKYTYKVTDAKGNVKTLQSDTTDNVITWYPDDVGVYNISVSVTDGISTVTNEISDFTVTKGAVTQPETISSEYVYGIEYNSQYECSVFMPQDCGNASYEIENKKDNKGIIKDINISKDGLLSYSISEKSSLGDSAEFTVRCISDRYEDICVDFEIVITDKKQVFIKDNQEMTVSGTLVYGENLSKVKPGKVIFINENGEEISGVLKWENDNYVPDVGNTAVSWIFEPNDKEYQTMSGLVNITVEKADVQVPVIERQHVYNPTYTLGQMQITDVQSQSQVTGEIVRGTIVFEEQDCVPTVDKKWYSARFVPAGEDTLRYNEAQCVVNISTQKAVPELVGTPNVSGLVYGQKLSECILSEISAVCGDSVVNGTFTFAEPETVPQVSDSVENNHTQYEIIFTPEDTVNYERVDKIYVSVYVAKSPNPPIRPDEKIVVDHCCTKVSQVKLPEGWKWQEDNSDTEIPIDSDISVTAVFENHANYEDQKMSIVMSRKDHTYEAEFVWEDYSQAEAVVTCAECGEEHRIEAQISINMTPATTGKTGYKEYSAIAEFDGQEYEDVKTAVIPKAKVSLSYTSTVYNGKVKKPTVTVKADGNPISKDNYTVTYSAGCKKAGKYTVTVKFKNDYTGSKKLSYTIVPKGTTIKTITAGTKKLTVKWKKQTTQVTGYQIQYSTSKSFNKNVKSTYVSGGNKTSTTIKSLKAKKGYYVRIRTYKTVNSVKYYSAWSKAKYKKTK